MLELCTKILQILNTQMDTPKPYGAYHLVWLALVGICTVLLCTRFRRVSRDAVRKTVFFVAVAVAVLEIYKQVNYSFHVGDGGITFDYQWYAFPWQFCSMPMYVGLLTGIFRKGKIHDALCAFLASYSVFAGVCVMVYPADVFCGTAGVNIQTMICHGSMVVIGIWLLATEYVPVNLKSWRGATAVFAAAVALAVVMNEGVYYSGVTGEETFNMFFISRHFAPSLPVYSQVQAVVAYPWCLVIYVTAFALAAGLVMKLYKFFHAFAIKRSISKVKASCG